MALLLVGRHRRHVCLHHGFVGALGLPALPLIIATDQQMTFCIGETNVPDTGRAFEITIVLIARNPQRALERRIASMDMISDRRAHPMVGRSIIAQEDMQDDIGVF
jgi:hypothetical protein